jgi:lipopolysaccharide transport system permease protein
VTPSSIPHTDSRRLRDLCQSFGGGDWYDKRLSRSGHVDHMNLGNALTSAPTYRSGGAACHCADLVVIDSGNRLGSLSDLVARRELLYFLIWRDIKIRYKQTVLGILWAILVPVLQTFLFTVIFGRFAKIETDGNYPYTVFVLAGLIPWMLFSQALTLGGQSLINQQHLMTKVYFPRLYIPAAAVGGCLIDFLVSLVLYGMVLAYFGIVPSTQIVMLPAMILLTITASLGVAFLLSALTISYRDFKYVIPFAVQVLMYASPIVYPVNLIPEKYRFFLGLNPMAGIVDGYRSAILGKPWDVSLLLEAVVSTLFFFVIGVVYFRKTEDRFADLA